ncbi:myosin-7-like [Toxorhynchites rutilus septentrionalis]|uniref:myosin-7-like n=1 Tax=Toxorhynchites rutilus septentrionalis TaxID=329112 RepID=UPI0024799727|nr:myosin-7-like [Toxorhynchites rutilus septentrionalis]XP_055642958.1 myosin-7-like [Toxorhynchites rutilus septentrionalis]
MDYQDFVLVKNDFDLENIRNHLIKCICELQSKRNEVTTLATALGESSRTKSILEQDVKNYEREIADLRDQLKIALDALNQKDAIRTDLLEKAARHNVQLEAMTNDHERLNTKLQSFQVKIMELARENKRLQEQVKSLQAAHSQPSDSSERMWKAMDTLNGHLQKLEAEHKVLVQTAESSNKIAGEAAMAIGSYKDEIKTLQEENSKKNRIILDLESRAWSNESEGRTSLEKGSDLYKKLEDHLKTLQEELDSERESNNKLRNDIVSLLTLKDSLSEQLEEAVAHYGTDQSNPPNENIDE